MHGSDLDRKYLDGSGAVCGFGSAGLVHMGEGTVLVYGRPVELRLVPLIVIGGLALRTVLARQAEKIRRRTSC